MTALVTLQVLRIEHGQEVELNMITDLLKSPQDVEEHRGGDVHAAGQSPISQGGTALEVCSGGEIAMELFSGILRLEASLLHISLETAQASKAVRLSMCR